MAAALSLEGPVGEDAREAETVHCPQPSRPPACLFPVTAGAVSFSTSRSGATAFPPCQAGTEGMCVARLGGGDFKQTALAPASAEAHHPHPSTTPQTEAARWTV